MNPNCPACGAELATGVTTCACGADVSLLQKLAGVADAWFNRGVRAARAGEAGDAIEWLAACCAARPGDAAARRELARAWAVAGCPQQARLSLDRAASLDPTAPELAMLRAAVETMAARENATEEQADG